MADRKRMEEKFDAFGFKEFKWIEPDQIVLSQWVRMKCMFGCGDFGQNAVCPPNTPTFEECVRFFGEFKDIAVFRFEKKVEKPEMRHDWTKGISRKLLELERDVFISGNRKAFLLMLDSCHFCQECASKKRDCKLPKMSRPTPEGMCMDVYATVRKVGFPIEVLHNYDQPMNRYAFLLID